MSVTFEIKGLRDLDQVLADELPKATARAVLRRALLSAAEPMAAKARSLAPDDPNTIDLDRDLRESISVSTKAHGSDPGKAAFSQTLRGGGTRTEAVAALRSARRQFGGAKVAVFVGPTRRAYHGIFQEFGTVNHGPQSFMRPAFDSEKDEVLRRLRADLADEINRAVDRAQRKALRAKAG